MKVITIAGGIGRDAELRTTQSGKSVANFSVAVGGRNDETTWFDVAIWGKRGEALVNHLTKGSKVTVCGDLGTREHNGKTYLTVNAQEVTLQGGKPSGGGQQGYSTPPAAADPLGGDEIPFLYEWRG